MYRHVWQLQVSVEGFSNERITRVIEQIKVEYSAQGAKINESDGIRIDSEDWYDQSMKLLII